MSNCQRFEERYRHYYKTFWMVYPHDRDVERFMRRAISCEYVSLHQTPVAWTLAELGIPATPEALCAYLTMG